MYSEPWAKLMILSTPKMSESPDAIRNRNMAVVRPLRSCPIRNVGSGSSNIAYPPAAGRDALSSRRGRAPHAPPRRGRRMPPAAPARHLAAASIHERRGIDVFHFGHDRVRLGGVLDHLAVVLPAV